jgi:hypothetical protein
MNDATNQATEIETLRKEIRIAEHNVDHAAPDYVVEIAEPGYWVSPKQEAQASLD